MTPAVKRQAEEPLAAGATLTPFNQMPFLSQLLFVLGSAKVVLGVGILLTLAVSYPLLPEHPFSVLITWLFSGGWTMLLGSLLILASKYPGRIRTLAKNLAMGTGLATCLLILAARLAA